MNKTVELVNRWGAFETDYPEASIEDFCRHVLAHKCEDTVPALSGDIKGTMLRTIGRIAKITTVLAAGALEGSEVKSIEEAGLLLYVDIMEHPKKSEAIYSNLLELSSGVDMLNRLVKRDLLREYADTEDRRSKRMKLTSKGMETVIRCKEQLKKMADMLTKELSEDDMQLGYMLLKGIDERFTPIVLQMKNNDFEKLYRESFGTAGDKHK